MCRSVILDFTASKPYGPKSQNSTWTRARDHFILQSVSFPLPALYASIKQGGIMQTHLFASRFVICYLVAYRHEVKNHNSEQTGYLLISCNWSTKRRRNGRIQNILWRLRFSELLHNSSPLVFLHLITPCSPDTLACYNNYKTCNNPERSRDSPPVS